MHYLWPFLKHKTGKKNKGAIIAMKLICIHFVPRWCGSLGEKLDPITKMKGKTILN
jgi:hypothetical protein